MDTSFILPTLDFMNHEACEWTEIEGEKERTREKEEKRERKGKKWDGRVK